jgi:GntR family transcriptional regulator
MEAFMITFRLDPASGVPTYLQLVQQVEHALRSGALRRGDQLPLVREVVQGLAINPNTVLKAYKQLEVLGLTEGRPGLGTFIRDDVAPSTTAGYPALQRRLATWIVSARDQGLDEQDIRSLFSATLHEIALDEGIA